MTIDAYKTLYDSSVTFGVKKQLQAEQGMAEMEEQVKRKQKSLFRLSLVEYIRASIKNDILQAFRGLDRVGKKGRYRRCVRKGTLLFSAFWSNWFVSTYTIMCSKVPRLFFTTDSRVDGKVWKLPHLEQRRSQDSNQPHVLLSPCRRTRKTLFSSVPRLSRVSTSIIMSFPERLMSCPWFTVLSDCWFGGEQKRAGAARIGVAK